MFPRVATRGGEIEKKAAGVSSDRSLHGLTYYFGCGVDTSVFVDVFALAPFGDVDMLPLVLDDAFGVDISPFTRVSDVGLAFARHGMRDASRGSQLAIDLAGVAVCAFTPDVAPLGETAVFAAPFTVEPAA